MYMRPEADLHNVRDIRDLYLVDMSILEHALRMFKNDRSPFFEKVPVDSCDTVQTDPSATEATVDPELEKPEYCWHRQMLNYAGFVLFQLTK